MFMTRGKNPPPPTHMHPIFLGLMLKNDQVRTCKERTAKCEIKTNHFEKLTVYYSLCEYYSWGHGSAFKFIT